MFDTIGVGDRVTVRTPQGEEIGRAVIHNVGVRLWVLNIDGKPWLATRLLKNLSSGNQDGSRR